jgi:glycerol uptake facilitator protein
LAEEAIATTRLTAARRVEAAIEERGVPAYAAEFLGTFLLVFFVCTVVTLYAAGGLGFTDFAVIGLVHAFVLAMLVQTLGGTSGAHFNPAVTAALAALRKIRLYDAAIYWLVQLAGGVAGALVCRGLLLDEGKAGHYGATAVSQKILQGRAFPGLIAEIIGTFVLMWAIMGVAVNPRGARDWAGLVIGMALGFAVMCLGPLSGASFNPARSFGPAIVSGSWSEFWIYIVGPILGALLAAFGYRAMVLAPQDRVGVAPIEKLS